MPFASAYGTATLVRVCACTSRQGERQGIEKEANEKRETHNNRRGYLLKDLRLLLQPLPLDCHTVHRKGAQDPDAFVDLRTVKLVSGLEKSEVEGREWTRLLRKVVRGRPEAFSTELRNERGQQEAKQKQKQRESRNTRFFARSVDVGSSLIAVYYGL